MATAAKTPWSNAELTAFVKNSYNEGLDWNTTVGTLKTSGYSSLTQIVGQLKTAGWSDSEVTQYTRNPPGLSVILHSLGQGALLIPGALATGAAAEGAGAAEGAAGGAAAGAGVSTAAKAAVGAGLLASLGSLSDWQQIAVRALEALAGAALILLGLQALTGTGANGSPVGAVAAVRKVVK